MKKRFLTADSHDDYYEIPYNRLHRNLTRDALDSLEDEESTTIDDIPNKVTCRSKKNWDARYCTNAAKKWLKSKVNQPWNKNRQAFIEYTAGKGHYLVEENTTMIDGVLHINDWCGPRTLEEVRGETFYVDQYGILKLTPKKKYKRWVDTPRFLIHEKMVWFRRGPTLFYCVPLTSVKEKTPYTRYSFFASSLYGNDDFVFNHYTGVRTLPWQLTGKYVKKAEIRQAPKKEIPEAAYNLACIE